MNDIAALLAGDAFVTDPYPVYDALRDRGRVLWVEELGRWLITGHQEAMAVFGHEKVSSNRALADNSIPWPEGGIQPRGLPFTDPPDHTRLRRLVQHAFTARRVEQQRKQVATLVDDLLTAVAGRDEFDLVTDVAGPLPAIVLARLLGIPPEDHETFRRWVTTVIETIDPVSHRLKSGEGAEDRISLEHYFQEIIEQPQAARGRPDQRPGPGGRIRRAAHLQGNP